MTTTRESLANDVWRACDILRRDDNAGGVSAYLEHLSWLLFLRFLDAQEHRWEREAARSDQPYTPVLPERLRWRNWARRDWSGGELLPFVRERLIPALQSLAGTPLRDTVRGIFAGRTVVVAASPQNLQDVLAIVDHIDFDNRDDLFTVSQVYEELLRRLGRENRVAGEFYTPRPVVRFMVERVDPRPGETVYDPACGSGGFLVQALQLMGEAGGGAHLYGQEKKALPALLSVMNLALHGVSDPHVTRGNSLAPGLEPDAPGYDVILTNPPFGGTENRRIRGRFPVPAGATELLFLQHIMARLAPHKGARCGMVVPEGLLFRGGAFNQVKADLLQRFDLHTLVSLPPGTFAPYSAVKTALLFFRRPGPTREIWVYDLAGAEEGARFSKGNPIQDAHFERARALGAAWDAYRGGKGPRPAPSADSWIVPVETIVARDFDLSARNPAGDARQRTRPPQAIVAEMARAGARALAALEETAALLAGAGDLSAPASAGWAWRRLEDPALAEVLMGQSPPSETYNDRGDGLPFFQGKADFGHLSPTPRTWCSAPIRIAQPGDVLISVRAPVGPTNLCVETCCIGRGLAAIRPGPAVESKWLLFVLRALEPEIARRGQGSTFAGITKRDLAALRVPVPPLEVQRQQVAHLERILAQTDALHEFQRAAAERLARLEGALLARLVQEDGARAVAPEPPADTSE